MLFDAALDALTVKLNEGASYEQMEAWIDRLSMPQEEKACLWFVLKGEHEQPRRGVIFARDLVEAVG